MLMIFDALHLDGWAVRDLPYLERREILPELALGDGPAWGTPRHFLGADGQALIPATVKQGLEGVVAKRVNAPYSEGRRSSAWIKLKHPRSEPFVVTGWRERRGKLPEFFLARRRDGDLFPRWQCQRWSGRRATGDAPRRTRAP